MKVWLRHGLVGSVFLLTLVPLLVFDGLFFPFITGKAFFFRIVVELGLIFLFLLALFDRAYVPRITPVTVFFFVFVAVMLFADLFGANITRSIWSNFERMEGWIMLAHLFGLFLLFDRVLFIDGLWKRWLQASLGVSLLVAIHGVLQLLGHATIHQGGVRVDANFGNATYLAVYTLFHVFFAIWMFVRTSNFWARSSFALIGGLNLILLYFSGTRGALLGLFLGGLLGLFVYAFSTKSKKLIAASLSLLFVGILGFGILSTYKESSFVKNDPVLTRVASISLSAGETRFRIWNIALEGFKERPLLGWGQGNFNLVFSKHFNPKLYNQEPWFDRAHNVFFDWLIAGGVLGLGTYLLFFASLMWFVSVGRFDAIEKAIGIGLLGAYFVNNLFVFDNLTSYILFVFVAAWISSRVVQQYSLPKISIPLNIGASLIIIFGLYVIYAVNVPALNANGALLRALSPQYGVSERQAYFREALSYNSFANQEIREQMVQLAIGAMRQENLSIDARVTLLVDAATEMEKQVALMPESARIHLLYGLMHRLLGSNESAYEILSQARELAPKKQSVLFELALAAEMLRKKEEALAVFKEAYELDTSYEQAKELYEQAKTRLLK